jgi:hypothetical protein
VAFCSGRELHSRQTKTRGHLHGDSGSCTASSDDSGTDIIDRIDTDVEMSLCDFRQSCSNDDEGQVTGNVGDVVLPVRYELDCKYCYK